MPVFLCQQNTIQVYARFSYALIPLDIERTSKHAKCDFWPHSVLMVWLNTGSNIHWGSTGKIPCDEDPNQANEDQKHVRKTRLMRWRIGSILLRHIQANHKWWLFFNTCDEKSNNDDHLSDTWWKIEQILLKYKWQLIPSTQWISWFPAWSSFLNFMKLSFTLVYRIKWREIWAVQRGLVSDSKK